MTDKLYVWFGIASAIVLAVLLVVGVVADWWSKRSVRIVGLIGEYAGTDKLWNFFLKESEDIGTKIIIACQIASVLDNDDKVKILIPKEVTDYRLGFDFEHDSYEIRITNIKRIAPYRPPEEFTHTQIT